MSQLTDAILNIIKREGADKTMILGARLGALVRNEHEDLLREEMGQRGLKFVQLVQEIPEVQVVRNLGTGVDVLIGLDGAAPPSPRGQSSFLRPDAYAAFTRAGVRYSYDPETDEFHEGLPRKGGVECPAVRLSDVEEMRSDFAADVPEPDAGDLRAALDGQSGSLNRFREAVAQANLTAKWEQFRYDRLSAAIREWAAAHKVEVQPTWFHRAELPRPRQTGSKALLAHLASVMTDEEARAVLIPLGAIERYLSRRQRGPLG